MKIQIRKSVFESNSSSSHSLTWSGDGKVFNTKQVNVDENNNVLIKLDEYGWEEGIHTGVNSRLSYLATMMYDNFPKAVDESISPTELGRYAEFKEIYDWATSNGFSGLAITGDGYVDHQSRYGTIKDFLIANDLKDINEYLENNKIVIITGNDNEPYDFYYDWEDDNE